MRWVVLGLAVLLAAVLPGVRGIAAEKTARELLPASTMVYVEVPEPGKLVDLALDHPLARQIAEAPEYRQVLERPEGQRFESIVKQLEAKLGMDRRAAARALASGGLYVGFDLPSQGVVALVQTTDEGLALKARDAVIDLIRADAAAKGKADPVREDEQRGVKVQQIDQVHLAVLGRWLLATNKRLLAFMVIENYLGSGGESLAGNTHFQTVLTSRSGRPAVWAYADLRVLRQLGVLSAAAKKKSDNPLVELLAGGVVGLLPEASHATAGLDVSVSKIKLTATLPGDSQHVAKPREFY